ncbi:hypothetical protein PPTG_24578 [Phytophthora nicotianae INRA-310]|uniref:Uncharacterized protein n=1 Tax=Phytophthora nicotianae (strain INRA-310) TaxID=761204 RepID=W2PCQ7_PHYN3|nr:hypothetical protein PPTG_24578 [Phytophthora nicotianae INRA-310]ETM98626.1 hypothetical protein PPTG_24578 [Phytophthora nicotianae INRA-310]
MTAKPAVWIQIQYAGSRSKTEGGKQGIDFFNREDVLLAYGRTDKELCERQHIYNVMSRVRFELMNGFVANDLHMPWPPAAKRGEHSADKGV